MSRFAAIEVEMRRQTICQAIAVGILALWVLFWLQAVLIPFVLAIFIVSGLTPVLSNIQNRLSTTRLVAVLIASIIGIALVFVLWSIIWISIAQLKQEGGKYVQGAKAWRDAVPEWVRQPELAFQSLLTSDSGSDVAAAEKTPDVEEAAVPMAGTLDEQVARHNTISTQSGPSHDMVSEMINDMVKNSLSKLTDSMSYVIQTSTMVVIFLFFLLLGSSQATLPENTWQEIDAKIREYILTKSLISFFTGLAFGFVLWLFGIPLAAVFALLAFLFNFIPNIGPILACLLPLPLIVLDPEMTWWGMTLVIVLSSAVQIISGNVIEPRMMGDSFDVHPIAILLALMFWSLIWGMIGMFLAVPMTAIMKILFAKFEMTRPLADLLAGRIDRFSFKNFNFGGTYGESASDGKGAEA
ncbi:AI-2E family transporter [Blastopirellula marina]|uniref:AI-2E family transporter n=1 Tax=Blastopirellula marina TaxID=124 RepID=A0A2S8G788_9BACT|nr:MULTISPECIES: AI-2E family transporter [Pirellulaceae]PQO40283.1 AI-2E family transporter [Blastopirellula marina]RCS55831.1 AI-2E family transporter [Bremerella cremea]